MVFGCVLSTDDDDILRMGREMGFIGSWTPERPVGYTPPMDVGTARGLWPGIHSFTIA
jgi:hypothetical protein